MSTRSIVGIISKDIGPVGVYVHSGGSPDERIPVLRRIIQRHGAQSAARMLLEHTKTGGGWSYLTVEAAPHNSLGAERAKPIPGYGLAYRDGERTALERLEDFRSGHVPYAYFIEPDTGDIHCYDKHDDFKLTVYPAAENGSKS